MGLWTKIETAPASAAFFSWKLRFGKALPRVLPWFLKKANGRARTVPCPHTCSCIHRVTEDNFGVCNCGDCEDIPLSNEDVQVWEPNWTGLCTRVRDALHLEHKTCPPPARGVWQIGSFAGDALSILLVVLPERGAFNEAVARLVARVKGRFVVLTPTATHHDIESRDMVGRVGAGLIDVEGNMSVLASGRLVARKSSGELFGTFVPDRQDELRTTEAARIFELLRKLGTGDGIRAGPLDKVFRLMVLDGVNQSVAARRCACSEATISARVRTIEDRFGMSILRLQGYAAQVLEYESAVRGDRAARKRDGARPVAPDDPARGEGGEDA
jgi:hypothetical protein